VTTSEDIGDLWPLLAAVLVLVGTVAALIYAGYI
jgi:hypothetical protein